MMFLPVILSWIGPKPYLSARIAQAKHPHEPLDHVQLEKAVPSRVDPPTGTVHSGPSLAPSGGDCGSSQGQDNKGAVLEVN